MNIVRLELQSPLYDASSEIMHVVEEGRNHPPGCQRSGISLATAKSLLGVKASMGLDSMTCTKSELVAST